MTTIPGFTAEASVYRTSGSYRTVVSGASVMAPSDSISLPAFSWADLISHSMIDLMGDIDILWNRCDTPGSPCCRADSEVKTPHCHKGLGCNLTTNQCERCGGPGQVCCDGHFTGFSLKGYTGFLLDPSERISTCDPGLRCDATLAPDGISWVGTRRCQSCGTKTGGPCCAPDTSYGLGRCFTDATSGDRLVCNDPWAGALGACVPCGKWAGQPACIGGPPCTKVW
jgi:hypothetical protein